MSLINDHNGNQSSLRVATLGMVATILGTWSYVSITKGQLQPIDMEMVLLIGSAFGAKVIQKGKELQSND